MTTAAMPSRPRKLLKLNGKGGGGAVGINGNAFTGQEAGGGNGGNGVNGGGDVTAREMSLKYDNEVKRLQMQESLGGLLSGRSALSGTENDELSPDDDDDGIREYETHDEG